MAPIFVFCGGGRVGGTLLQRLIISSREALIWGEHGGTLLVHVGQMLEGMNRWLNGGARANRELLLTRGYNEFIGSMNPEMDAFVAGAAQFFEGSLGKAASDLGYPRWGFKEICYGGMGAVLLERMFPDAAFIFLIRSPLGSLRSVKGTPWKETVSSHTFLQTWATLSRDLLATQPKMRRSLLLKYETFVGTPSESLERIASVTGISIDRFDRDVFSHRQRGGGAPVHELNEADRTALRDPLVCEVAGRLGYALTD